MMFKHFALVVLAVASLVNPAQAQSKKELVAKLLLLQQTGVEGMARMLVEQPAMQIMQQLNVVVQQRVPQEKREALAREIQADLKKYVDETVPLVRDRAIKLAPLTIGVMLEEKLTEEELKQVIALLESPANRKFQALAGDMQRVLSEKLVAESRPEVQPKILALEQAVTKRVRTAAPGALAPAGPPSAGTTGK